MNLFQQVAGKKTRRSKFDLSHERKMSFNMGKLYPILLEEIVPGDKFRVSSEIMLRLSPLIAPMLHRVNVYTHYFFVPNRLVWSDWESFITGGRQGTDAPTWPNMVISDSSKANFGKKSLADYFGLPTVETTTTVTQGLRVSAMPFRAYQLIFQEYYQDQNLAAELGIDLSSGEMTGAELTKLTTLRDRAWEKDYFTSALPWSQRGPEVELPAEVNYLSESIYKTAGGGNVAAGNATFDGVDNLRDGSSTNTRVENIDDIGITINDLRQSVRLQEWLERTARGGSRYIEQILSHFGVLSSDKRLQRPEYLGGGKQPVVISEVLNTTGITGELPQGNMAGHGISVGATNYFKKRFEEHGFVVGIMSVLPRTAYQQGVHRMWRRLDKFDYYWPEFANLGEQAVENGEIYMDYTATGGQHTSTWGYQSRYAEYKYGKSTVHGDFRDDLSFWHMGRVFTSQPVLNESFVTANPTNRVFSVTDPNEDKLYAQIYNKIDAIRPMPYFGTPRL